MLRFVAIRLLRALVTVLAVMTFAFLVLRASGDPAVVLLGPDMPREAVDAFRQQWGLDKPLWQQYLSYLGAIFTGDFGISMRDRSPAIDLVLERLPATLMLTLPALVLQVVVGVSAGIYAALHRDSLIDRGAMFLAVLGFTVPNFVIGLVLVLIFSVQLGWLPSGGNATWQHAILPSLAFSVGWIGIFARFSRSAMIEVMGQPYIRTASAKGLTWGAVVRAHAFPNAAVPIVTLIGFQVGALVAGTVVIETVFSWPGIGRLMIVSVTNRDLAVVQCIMLMIALVMVISNLVVDLLYGWLDPRLRAASAH